MRIFILLDAKIDELSKLLLENFMHPEVAQFEVDSLRADIERAFTSGLITAYQYRKLKEKFMKI